MSNNGQDKSGNALKYSLIPLTLGVVLIFFLHRSCETAVFEPTPVKNAPTAIVENELESEQSLNESTANTTEEVEETTVENDTLESAE